MTKVKLFRMPYNKKATFGVLMMNNIPLCVTLEDPWKENKRMISCIPPGTYKCTPHNGTRFKDVWVLHDVPNRSYILIHAGNTTEDTHGCILVGRSFNAHTIRNSRSALDYLRAVLPDEFELQIIETRKPRMRSWFQ